MINELKKYPAYKDSGAAWLGEVPEHWNVRRLKHVLREHDARSIEGAEQLLRVSQYTGVTQRRRVDGGDEPDTRAASLIGYKRVELNELVINIMLAWNGSMGVSQYPGIVSPAYCVYKFEAVAQPWFFHHLLRSPDYRTYIKTVSTGIVESRLRLYTDALYRIEALIPPLLEQSSIVRFLDHADYRIKRCILAKQKMIKLLEEQKQAIIHQAVTRGLNPNVRLKPSGVEWLGDVPEHWEVRKLKFVMNFSGGGTPSKAEPSYWNGDIPWVSPKDMKSDVISDAQDHITKQAVIESSTKLVPSGSILMVVRSGILQRKIPIAICDREVALNQDMKALSPNKKLFSEYFIYLVRGCENTFLIEWTKQGATVESVEHQYLANTQIPVPPFDEQTIIVRFINEVTKDTVSTIVHIRNEISLLREYRTRLIADVVTGKLDVREAAKNLPVYLNEMEKLEEVDVSAEGDGGDEDHEPELAEIET